MSVDSVRACFFSVLFAIAAAEHAPPGDVIAWVSFGRVGSTTMREVLRHRGEMKGFRKYNGPDGLCHNKPIDWTVPRDQAVLCSDVEDDYVVQTEYGFCHRLHHSRPCRYMTLLRNPIDVIISEYNWFCRDCMEGGRQCVPKAEQVARKQILEENPQSTPQLTCPNMLITDYAKHYRNQYTMQFSGKKIFCSRTGEPQKSTAFRDCSETLSEVDYQAALQTLTSPNILVLRLETLWEGIPGVSPPGITKLAEFLQDPELSGRAEVHKNKHKKSYMPTDAELAELRRILSFDIRLYEDMRRREEQNVTAWEFQVPQRSAVAGTEEAQALPDAFGERLPKLHRHRGSRRRNYKWRRDHLRHSRGGTTHEHGGFRLRPCHGCNRRKSPDDDDDDSDDDAA